MSRSASMVSAGTRLAFSAASARASISGRSLRTRPRISAKSGRAVAAWRGTAESVASTCMIFPPCDGNDRYGFLLRTVTTGTVRTLHLSGAFDKWEMRPPGRGPRPRGKSMQVRWRSLGFAGGFRTARFWSRRPSSFVRPRGRGAGAAQPWRNTVTASLTVWSMRRARSFSFDAEVSQDNWCSPISMS